MCLEKNTLEKGCGCVCVHKWGREGNERDVVYESLRVDNLFLSDTCNICGS